MYRFGAPEEPPEEYEEEFSDVEDCEPYYDERTAPLGEIVGITVSNMPWAKGSVVPINPEITDKKGRFGGTWERCKVCGNEEFVRFDGHWVRAYDYVDYKTNIQF